MSQTLKKHWDRTDTIAFTLGSVACFIAAAITFGVLGAAVAWLWALCSQ